MYFFYKSTIIVCQKSIIGKKSVGFFSTITGYLKWKSLSSIFCWKRTCKQCCRLYWQSYGIVNSSSNWSKCHHRTFFDLILIRSGKLQLDYGLHIQSYNNIIHFWRVVVRIICGIHSNLFVIIPSAEFKCYTRVSIPEEFTVPNYSRTKCVECDDDKWT